jgi:hypothetical protein
MIGQLASASGEYPRGPATEAGEVQTLAPRNASATLSGIEMDHGNS